MLLRMETHASLPEIPEGMAVITMDNYGWVGTHNGYPFGQPALFRHDVAQAIVNAVMYVQVFHPKLEEMPNPDAMSAGARNLLDGTSAHKVG